jgi:threonine/homoserine/homoserine lactone efflux protein
LGFLIHFAWGWICSFFGTLPFGTINVSITEASIQRGVRVGVYMGIGASIVEFFQSYFALAFFNFLNANQQVEERIIMICIPIFLAVGIYYLFKKNARLPTATTRAANVIGFAKGFMLSVLNLIAVPYYVFIGGYLASSDYIILKAEFIAAFAAGVVVGSFAVFLIYAKLGQYIRKKSERMSVYASKIVGAIFIALAVSQMVRFWW